MVFFKGDKLVVYFFQFSDLDLDDIYVIIFIKLKNHHSFDIFENLLGLFDFLYLFQLIIWHDKRMSSEITSRMAILGTLRVIIKYLLSSHMFELTILPLILKVGFTAGNMRQIQLIATLIELLRIDLVTVHTLVDYLLTFLIHKARICDSLIMF